MPKQNSGLASRARLEASANKQYTNDIEQWGEMNSYRISEMDDRATQDEMDSDEYGTSAESVKWFMDTMNMDRRAAWEAAEAFLYWSYRGDFEAHRDIGKGKQTNDILDRVIEAPNAHVYSGTQWRGINVNTNDLAKMGISMTPRAYIESVLKSGIWREGGATSFGTSGETAAKSWAGFFRADGTDSIAVVVEYGGGKSGFPMNHLSHFSDEKEALHSRKQMRRGMPIERAQWSSDGKYVKIIVRD